jgi:hypothetical protein
MAAIFRSRFDNPSQFEWWAFRTLESDAVELSTDACYWPAIFGVPGPTLNPIDWGGGVTILPGRPGFAPLPDTPAVSRETVVTKKRPAVERE